MRGRNNTFSRGTVPNYQYMYVKLKFNRSMGDTISSIRTFGEADEETRIEATDGRGDYAARS